MNVHSILPAASQLLGNTGARVALARPAMVFAGLILAATQGMAAGLSPIPVPAQPIRVPSPAARIADVATLVRPVRPAPPPLSDVRTAPIVAGCTVQFVQWADGTVTQRCEYGN
jgi:hypothetical protein